MNKSLHSADVIAAQLDRLVSGDLPEPDRRSLLAWLDEEPTRWRACALAFLEAQVFEQATAPSAVGNALCGVPREGEAPAEPPRDVEVPCAVGNALRGVPGVQAPRGYPGFRVQAAKHDLPFTGAHWLALASSLLVAFAVGTLAGRSSIATPVRTAKILTAAPQPSAPPGFQLATVSVRTNLDPRITAQVQLPVEPADQPLAGASSISEYDRKLWERRGYELVEETRYLPAKMPDGRPVMVPVNRVHLKLKGTPVS